MILNLRKILLILIALATCGSSLMNNFKTENSNILMLLPFGSTSHRNVFLPLAKSLADKGHKITILSALPPKTNHSQIKEINHGIDLVEGVNMFEQRQNDKAGGGLAIFEEFLPKLARELYDVSVVKELYDHRNQFDLIIIDELFNEFAYPFIHGQTFMFLCTGECMPASSAMLGNPIHPGYVPHIISEGNVETFLDRWQNLFKNIFFAIYWRFWSVVPLVQTEISKRFPDLPPLLELERNVSLILSNSHFSHDHIYPTLPNQIQVGGIHINNAGQLPKDIKDWIEGAGPEGVIYFSLGSIAKGTTMPKKYRDIFVEVFSKIPQRVIWKFEGEIAGLSSNVLLKNWLPQQDILAHPNVKIFLTHGGLLSIQESLYHGTPLLALPIFGDQPKNGKKIEVNNYGRMAVWEDLTTSSLIAIFKDMLENPVYSETVKMISTLFKDKPATAVETATWWTEYVIRHKGATNLRSNAKDLSWIQFFYLDLIATFHVFGIAMFWLMKRICRSFCGSSKSKSVHRKMKMQ